jgi:hypothetical protein
MRRREAVEADDSETSVGELQQHRTAHRPEADHDHVGPRVRLTSGTRHGSILTIRSFVQPISGLLRPKRPTERD